MSDPYTLPLAEKIDPAYTALVVIDYQNDYMAESGAFERTGSDAGMMRAIEPSLAAILAAARAAGVHVVFVKSVYSTPDNRFLSRAFLHQARRMR
ncbi:MAG: isochorismatase family protein, partial [Betaproteobacteria bacterium]|nr:isochorismatase family protein [Betaproteobacteria bacterium]